MELGGYGFEKSELMKIAEEIYELKGKKQDLELTLHGERFHYKYIPKRKNLVEHEVTFRLLWIIPITICVLAALIFIVWYVLDLGNIGREGETAAAMGVVFLCTSLLAAFGGYAAFKLWKREIHMLTLLWLHRNPEKAAAFSKKHDINTFQNDEAKSKQRIAMLEEEISSIATRIRQLEEQQVQLLEERKRSEKLMREKGVLFDENPKLLKSNGKFSLREESVGAGDIRDLYECYVKEEQYNRNYLQQLDIKRQLLDKDIQGLSEHVEDIKRKGIILICIFLFLIVAQGAFSGIMGGITAILCFCISFGMLIYAENKCKLPIIMYLVEQEHPIIQEYAFCHNMTPIRIRKDEITEKMNEIQKELDDIKKKKQALDV